MTDAASARDVMIDQLKDAVIRAARTVYLCGVSVRKDEMREACIEGRAELQNTILALDAALSAPAADAGEITAEPKHTIREYAKWDKAMER